jgi:3-oxoacyl-ACP reductase-like protein
MSFFSKIKNAIFGKKTEAATPPATTPAIPMGQAPAAPAPAPATAPVDVEAVLGGMAGADKLNWQSSIVDLMKLVGIDSSYGNRKELAAELGDTNYSGSAEDNIALHKAVMRGLAENGGHMPAKMLD